MNNLSRFERGKIHIKIKLTARDARILEHLASNRFLHSQQIAELAGGSRQQILRRLQQLFHHGYLDRPRTQIRYFSESGSRPLVYALASKGSRAINASGISKPRPDNRNVKQLYMRHTLLVSDVMVAFARAAKEAHVTRLLTEAELAPGKLVSKAFSWSVVTKDGGKSKRVGVLPDRAFALQSPTTGEQTFYFLEADGGTMPIRRRSLEQTSIWRKYLAYEATWSQGLHQSRFGAKRFRVLFVNESEERMKNLVNECAKLSKGKGLFLFTTAQALRESRNIYAHLWHTVSGKMETIWNETPTAPHDMMLPIAAHDESHVLFSSERNSLCLPTFPATHPLNLNQPELAENM